MIIQPCPGCAATNQVQLERIRQLERERDAWIDTANQHCRNEQFYHGLLTAVGELFGDAAKRQDDGGLCEDVLALRVHECVVAVLAQLAAAQEALTLANSDRATAWAECVAMRAERDAASSAVLSTAGLGGKIKRLFCSHRFALEDLKITGTATNGDDRVSWPCDKCGKVFRAPYGLAIAPHFGPIFRRNPTPNAQGQRAADRPSAAPQSSAPTED